MCIWYQCKIVLTCNSYDFNKWLKNENFYLLSKNVVSSRDFNKWLMYGVSMSMVLFSFLNLLLNTITFGVKFRYENDVFSTINEI